MLAFASADLPMISLRLYLSNYHSFIHFLYTYTHTHRHTYPWKKYLSFLSMLALSFCQNVFSYIGFASRWQPHTEWVLNQCKATISTHLLGSSLILKVFHYFSHSLFHSAEPTLWVYYFSFKMSLCQILLFSDWNPSVFIPQAPALIYFITTPSYPFPFPNLILFFFTPRASANITSGEANENSSFCPRLQTSSAKIKT